MFKRNESTRQIQAGREFLLRDFPLHIHTYHWQRSCVKCVNAFSRFPRPFPSIIYYNHRQRLVGGGKPFPLASNAYSNKVLQSAQYFFQRTNLRVHSFDSKFFLHSGSMKTSDSVFGAVRSHSWFHVTYTNSLKKILGIALNI